MSELSNASIRELRKRLRAELRSYEKAASDVRSALNDLEAAERLLGRLDTPPAKRPDLHFPVLPKLPFSDGNPFTQGSNRAVIWEVLNQAPDVWMTTEEVRQKASKLLKRTLSRNSVGVSLSRMKPNIYREGQKVATAQRALQSMGILE